MQLRRIALLVGALVVTTVASFMDMPDSQPEISDALVMKPSTASKLKNGEHLPPPNNAPRPALNPVVDDLFASRSWLPHPVPQAPLPPRSAPVLPFSYLGKRLEGSDVMVFLGQGGRTHLIRAGDTVAEYKVEQISSTEVTFTYLPLNEKQLLKFGSAN